MNPGPSVTNGPSLEDVVRQAIDHGADEHVRGLVKVYMAEQDADRRFIEGLRKLKQRHAAMIELVGQVFAGD